MTERTKIRECYEWIAAIERTLVHLRGRVDEALDAAGDGVVDVEIRCSAVYLLPDLDALDCTQPDGHTGDHTVILSWKPDFENDMCEVTMMIDHGRRRIACRLPIGHDGIHTPNP